MGAGGKASVRQRTDNAGMNGDPPNFSATAIVRSARGQQVTTTSIRNHSRVLACLGALLLSALTAGCGDPVLGMGADGNSGTPPVAADTTRPRVTVTQPATTSPGPTPGAPANTSITAVFTEEMNPATIDGASFTLTCALPCVAPSGAVGYTAGTRTATFRPAAVLAVGQTYTATITTAATDLAGNALAGNQAPPPAASAYIWTFNTVAAVAAAPVTVVSTRPAAGAAGVCPRASINATFDTSGARMDPATITAATFIVTGPGLTAVSAESVVLDDATGLTATFTPRFDLVNGTTYTVTLDSGANGVKDLAVPANQMAADFVWTFTAGPATTACLAAVPVALASAAPMGTMGGSAGMTNQGTLTVVNGDISTMAVSTAVTGFHDPGFGCTYTETAANIGTVNGKIYTAAPPPTVDCPTEGTAETFEVARQAREDARAAYDYLAGLATTGVVGANLSGLTVPPGVYFSASGFMIQDGLPGPAGDLTLDGLGDANAVWVFQSASTLLVGGPGAAFPRSVNLINGAQAKNVFWQVGTFATLNAAGGGTMKGTILTQDGGSISTAGNVTVVTLDGRILSLGAAVTVVNTVINVPAP